MSDELPTLAQVQLVELPCHVAENGALVVMQGGAVVPFTIARVFVVRSEGGTSRGDHAHKACVQFLTCSIGAIDVLCDDGTSKATFRLDRQDLALVVPAGIWCGQTYLKESTVLTVLCDRPYESDDYLRQYSEFLAFRRSRGKDAGGL